MGAILHAERVNTIPRMARMKAHLGDELFMNFENINTTGTRVFCGGCVVSGMPPVITAAMHGSPAGVRQRWGVITGRLLLMSANGLGQMQGGVIPRWWARDILDCYGVKTDPDRLAGEMRGWQFWSCCRGLKHCG